MLAFQARPSPLLLDEFYRGVDTRLALASQTYRERSDAAPFERVYLEPGPGLTGQARYERMRVNLVEALRDEAVLIVLDNFETNLDKTPAASGYRCSDPEWDRLLEALCRDLPGTRSRLLVTSRHLPAVLAGTGAAIPVILGPLPLAETTLYLHTHPRLRELLFDDEGLELALRLQSVARGHPLIMNRLAALAGDRPALAGALAALEKREWGTLPDLFAPAVSEEDRERERRYLEDVAIGSIDFLVERLSPEARRLLWIVTLANEPVPADLLAGVWSGRTLEEERHAPPLGPPLAELTGAGLVTGVGEGALTFHELVRERIAAWMEGHEAERGGRSVEGVWVAYGERYAAMFSQLQTSGVENARALAAEAGRRGLTYLARAGALDKLSSFASGLVTGTRDPALLRAVIKELEGLADRAPAGEPRWSLRTYLADALRRSGRPDQALALYGAAAAEAEAAGHWADLGWICGNWAAALGEVGQLDGAKATYLRSADAGRKAGRPRVKVIGSELGALRVDIMQGRAEAALPGIEARLAEVRGWWGRHRAGKTIPTECAPDPVTLGRTLVSGLDIAGDASRRLERWEACLALLEEIERAEREMGESKHEQSITRFNRYFPLVRLGRLDEAQRVVEDCLAVFRDVDDLQAQSGALSALATIWYERGDVEQAVALGRQALSLCNRLPDPSDRAISHDNLASYLGKAGRAEEAARHRLAAGVYYLVTTRRDYLATWLGNLRIDIRRAAGSGGRYELPRLADLLARPEFEALARFLVGLGVESGPLQAQLDELVEGVRKEAGL